MLVDFYILSNPNLEARDEFACQLIEKAFWSHHKLFVVTDSTEHAMQFDDLLWAFRSDSFIPHAQADTSFAPIIIGTLDQIRPGYDVWVNLSDQQPDIQHDVQHLIEIVPKIPAKQALARERFRQYRELGYTLQSHHIS